MGFYHIEQICLNGHLITNLADKYPELCQSHCSCCGASTITHCPTCNFPLHGNYDRGMSRTIASTSVDAYFYNCGAPYPWTEIAIQSTSQVIMQEKELADIDKNSMIESLPDIITETPKTSLAALRLKKGLSSVGKFTADAIRQFIIDFGCELAIKLLDL